MRTIILPLGLLWATSILAQDKGFISGTFAFESRTVDADGSFSDRTTTTGTFGPAVGYNLSPEHVIGLALTHTGSTEEYQLIAGFTTVEVTEVRSLTTIAPFYRYMKSMNEKFLLYGQLKAGIGFGKETEEAGTSTDEVRLNTVDVRVGPGLVYLFADRWAASADWGVLGYAGTKSTQELASGDVVTNIRSFKAALDPAQLTLALNWLF
ncbi:MAG: hypothetical protein ACO1NQ_08720 [Flavobacteriales bacterium]